MPDSELLHTRLPVPQDAEVADYKAVSVLAVLGLLAGLLTVTALLSPAMWIVVLVGLVLNSLALMRIAQEAPALIGRKAALAGLALSLFFGAVAVADWYTYSAMARREARQFATLWFENLRDREPQRAHQLTLSPNMRRPFDDKLWSVYYEGSDTREELESYLDRAEVKALMALGGKAQVRYYASPMQSQGAGNDIVSLVYAVTFPEAQEKKTFFLKLVLERHRLAKPARAEWRILNSEGGVGPDGRIKQ